MRESLTGLSAEALYEKGPHDELTRIVDAISGACDALHTDYFDPPAAAVDTAATTDTESHPP